MLERHYRRKKKGRMLDDGMRHCEGLMSIYREEFLKDGAKSVIFH